MTIDELEASLNEEFNGYIRAVSFADDALTISLDFDDWASDGRLAALIVCRDLASWNVSPGWVECVHESCEGPLLWQHNEEQLELYFSSRPANSFELIGRLRERLAELYRPHDPPSGLLHATAQILAGGSGMLAQGPRPVIENLRRLAESSVSCSVVAGHIPAGGYRLLDLGRSHAVCRSIELSVATKPPN